ncbi:MAG TPA: thioredoxin family protein [Kofleriaceae bacterium]|nr:thioredoxin family protein [Kofleriaceae bacterium]
MKRLVVIALALWACDKKPAPEARSEPAALRAEGSDHARSEEERAARGAVTADPCARARSVEGEVMPWIIDDLPSALACARVRKVPVAIDLWAPWCHTCLSMQTTVFTDPSLKPAVERFVFARLDTDKPVNADAVGKYPPSAWPTFYVVGEDRSTGKPETVLARFVGAASLSQFHAFLDAGLKAQQGGAAGADAHLLGAERAIAVKDLPTAEQELVAALAQAPADWSRRGDSLTALILTKRRRGDLPGCLETAEKSIDDTGSAANATDFVVHAMACADELKADAAWAARVKKLRERAVARLTKLVADDNRAMSIDDRSDALANLRSILDALGKPAEAKATAERQRAMLDDAAVKAPTAIAAMTFNWQRCEVYVYLGRPLEMVPALEKSAHDLPNEYDPRARMGWIYLKAGKLPEAARWTDEALRLVYGPRKARVLAQRIEIADKQGDKAAARLFREETVKLWEQMPPGQASPEALAKAKEAVSALDAPAGSGGGSGSGSASARKL